MTRPAPIYTTLTNDTAALPVSWFCRIKPKSDNQSEKCGKTFVYVCFLSSPSQFITQQSLRHLKLYIVSELQRRKMSRKLINIIYLRSYVNYNLR
jgi:hypothetical protein